MMSQSDALLKKLQSLKVPFKSWKRNFLAQTKYTRDISDVIKAIPLSALDLRVPINCVIERNRGTACCIVCKFETITSPNNEQKYGVPPYKLLDNHKNRLLKQLCDLNPNVLENVNKSFAYVSCRSNKHW
jgi:hypothetical protein